MTGPPPSNIVASPGAARHGEDRGTIAIPEKRLGGLGGGASGRIFMFAGGLSSEIAGTLAGTVFGCATIYVPRIGFRLIRVPIDVYQISRNVPFVLQPLDFATVLSLRPSSSASPPTIYPFTPGRRSSIRQQALRYQ